MKKLTAGIMTVMLGLVVANADAAITSQKYVDDAITGVNTTITTNVNNLNTTINGVKEDVADLQDIVNGAEGEDGLVKKLDDLEQTVTGEGEGSINAALAEIETNYKAADKAITDKIGTVPDGKTVVGMISASEYDDAELSGKITALETAVGDAESGIKKDVADNAAAIEILNGDAETEGSVAKALVDAKAYTDTQIGDLGDAESVAAALDAITSSETGIIADAKGYTDTEVGKVTNTIGEVSAVNMGADAANNTVVKAIKQANDTANQAKATANAAIPAPTPECTDKEAKCVLVVGEAGYAWEVIQRGTTETVE